MTKKAKGPVFDEPLSPVNTPIGVTSEVYKGFVYQGTVAPSEGEPEVPVNVLRDTGAAQSLLLAGLMSWTDKTSLKASVLLKGLGGEYGAVPLHRV